MKTLLFSASMAVLMSFTPSFGIGISLTDSKGNRIPTSAKDVKQDVAAAKKAAADKAAADKAAREKKAAADKAAALEKQRAAADRQLGKVGLKLTK